MGWLVCVNFIFPLRRNLCRSNNPISFFCTCCCGLEHRIYTERWAYLFNHSIIGIGNITINCYHFSQTNAIGSSPVFPLWSQIAFHYFVGLSVISVFAMWMDKTMVSNECPCKHSFCSYHWREFSDINHSWPDPMRPLTTGVIVVVVVAVAVSSSNSRLLIYCPFMRL